MIRETTYRLKEIKQEINAIVGKSMSILKRLKMGGNGSQRLIIVEAFKELEELINVDNKSKFCNLEIRENGIILHFRSRLETYAWIVPFHLMSLFKSEDSISIYAGAEFVRLRPAHNSTFNHKFIQKILDMKASNHSYHNDLN